MPHYEIHHSCGLEQPQKQDLATALTNIHCELFSAPSAFVNVSFHQEKSPNMFVAGLPQATNYIHGHLRPRGPEGAPKLRELLEKIMAAWVKHVKHDLEGSLTDSKALHNVFIFDDVATGMEQGFLLPKAGEDKKWADENLEAFEKRARDGDEAMKKMAEEARRGFGRRA